MQGIFNKDGFNWWIGVVENRQDPEKLGRCKVRIFGYHTDSKERFTHIRVCRGNKEIKLY